MSNDEIMNLISFVADAVSDTMSKKNSDDAIFAAKGLIVDKEIKEHIIDCLIAIENNVIMQNP